MSRIDATFAALRDRKRTALIPYVTVGDPHADGTVDLLRAMAAAGADVIELAATMRPDQHLLVNLSGRGDKDIATVAGLDAERAGRAP